LTTRTFSTWEKETTNPTEETREEVGRDIYTVCERGRGTYFRVKCIFSTNRVPGGGTTPNAMCLSIMLSWLRFFQKRTNKLIRGPKRVNCIFVKIVF